MLVPLLSLSKLCRRTILGGTKFQKLLGPKFWQIQKKYNVSKRLVNSTFLTTNTAL